MAILLSYATVNWTIDQLYEWDRTDCSVKRLKKVSFETFLHLADTVRNANLFEFVKKFE